MIEPTVNRRPDAVTSRRGDSRVHSGQPDGSGGPASVSCSASTTTGAPTSRCATSTCSPARHAARRRALGARRREPIRRARPGTPAAKWTGQASTRRTTHPRPRTTSTTNTHDTLDDIPSRVTAPALPHLHHLHDLPARPTPDCLPLSYYSLAHPHPRQLLLAAAPPPAQPLHAWAAPRFIWQVEEGGSSAKRWTPLPRKPGPDGGSGPEAGPQPVTS